MSTKHLVFVINPKAGIDREKSIKNTIQKYIDPVLYSFEIKHTKKPKHGIEIAKDAAGNGAFAVVAIGGDGSVNDIAKGLLHTDTALGIIPKGSGNGVARTLGIPLDEAEAMKKLNKGNTSYMDLGMAGGHLFTSNMGVGFDAVIAKSFATNKTRGFIGYTSEVVKNLISYKEKHWHISIDGQQIESDAFMVVIANCREFGYNFQIAPMARWDDNLFEVILIKKFPIILGTSVIYKAMTGKITNSRFVEHFSGNKIYISSNELSYMQTDGDYYSLSGSNTVEVSMLHKTLKVIH